VLPHADGGLRHKGLKMQGIGEGADHNKTPRSSDIAKAIVAKIYGVNVKDLRSRRRKDARTALARQIAMYLSHIVLEMSFAEIGLAFRRSRSTACYALRHVEDMREDMELDSTLLQLEVLLRQAVGVAA